MDVRDVSEGGESAHEFGEHGAMEDRSRRTYCDEVLIVRPLCCLCVKIMVLARRRIRRSRSVATHAYCGRECVREQTSGCDFDGQPR